MDNKSKSEPVSNASRGPVDWGHNIESYLEDGAIKFEAPVDMDKLREFCKKHDEHINKSSRDPIFKPAYTIQYKPSTVGMDVHIICECGAKEDISNYDNF